MFTISPDTNFIEELVSGIKARHSCLENGLIILPNEISRSVCEASFEPSNRPHVISLGKIFSAKEGIAEPLDCFLNAVDNNLDLRDISLIKLLFTMKEHDASFVSNQNNSEYIEKSLSIVSEIKDFCEDYFAENSLQDLATYRKDLALTLPKKLCSKHDFVYLAGSTCSNPYTKDFARELMKNGGDLVLSALDKHSCDVGWQRHLRELLAYLDAGKVEPWNGLEGNCQDLFKVFSGQPVKIKKNIRILSCKNELEEGFCCSELLEEGIKNGEKVALVTNDRFLAERVAWDLRHHNPDFLWSRKFLNTYEGNLILLSCRFLFEKSITAQQMLSFAGKMSEKKEEVDNSESYQVACQHLDSVGSAVSWDEVWTRHKEFLLWLDDGIGDFIEQFECSFLKYLARLKCRVNLKLWNEILGVALDLNCPQTAQFKNSPLMIGNFIETRLLDFDRVVLGASIDDQIPGNQNFFEDELLEGVDKGDSVLNHCAYDFVRLICKEKVFITHGSVDMISRFVSRLTCALEKHQSSDYSWKVPETTPSIEHDPTSSASVQFLDVVSVSDINLLMQNPYAFYVKKILRVEESQLSEEFGYKESGSLIHFILRKFVNEIWSDKVDLKCMENALMKLGQEEFEKKEGSRMHWLNFNFFVKPFVKWQKKRSEDVSKTFTEVNLIVPLKKFKLRGRIDRIDLMKDGSISILDYKRTFPKTSFQLPLYGLLVQLDGRFGDFETYNLEYLEYGRDKSKLLKRETKTKEVISEMKDQVESLEITRQFNNKDKALGSEYAYMAGAVAK